MNAKAADIGLFDVVELRRSLPELGLQAGAQGTVVLVHDSGRAFEVEFADIRGQTEVMAAIEANDLVPVHQHCRVAQ